MFYETLYKKALDLIQQTDLIQQSTTNSTCKSSKKKLSIKPFSINY